MKRSKHNLSHYHLLTHNMGQLVPIGVCEVLPGDTIQHSVSCLVRAAPMFTPPMHPVRYKVHHWFVPFRLLWDNGKDDSWEAFITGGHDGMDASVFPTISLSNVALGSLADYLGVPVGFTGAVNALFFRAYAKIYNEWYRDQDLMSELDISVTGGADSTTNTTLQFSAWEKDYFTTCRPWEQKGPGISLPLGTVAPVISTGSNVSLRAGTGGLQTLVSGSTGIPLELSAAVTASTPLNFGAAGTDTTGLQADLTNATAVDVNDVRFAFAMQRYQEARARYGSRYTEFLRYLGVNSSDARLQRPEYLGGGKQNLQFSEVLQTAQTDPAEDSAGVGQLYGHGIAGIRSNTYRKFFEEHGCIISLAHCLPTTMYPQGLFRHWNRRTKEDFWQRELQHIGQQPVLNKEVYALGAQPDDVFGYQDRFDEYRRCESQVHGEFRTLLDDWHFARFSESQYTLNSSFVTANPAKRPFQSQSTDVLYVNAQHHMVARRLVAAKGSSFIF